MPSSNLMNAKACNACCCSSITPHAVTAHRIARPLARPAPGSSTSIRGVQTFLKPRQIALRAQSGGLGDEDNVDVAVFRFTLGIPGFEDRLIPRFVGAAVAALVAVNHVLGAQPAPEAQVRAEFLVALLALLCVAAPEIEARLREAGPAGRGRRQAALDQVAGASSCFALASSLDEVSKKELAWASFALLRNANCCSVAVLGGQRALMARGALGSAVVSQSGADATLDSITRDLTSSASSSTALQSMLAGRAAKQAQQQQLWLPDRAAMSQAGVDKWACIPAGVQCVLVQGLEGVPGAVIAMSEKPGGLSDKDRKWVAAIAQKLSISCPAMSGAAAVA